MQHTPGEWRFIRRDDDIRRFHIYTKDAVGTTSGIADTANYEWTIKQEHEANATLIAAAPDLLAACRAFVGAYHLDSAADEPVSRAMAEAYSAATAAIAKAEGKVHA